MARKNKSRNAQKKKLREAATCISIVKDIAIILIEMVKLIS